MGKESYKVRIWKKEKAGRKKMHGHMGPYANRKAAEQDAKSYKENRPKKFSTEIIKITPLKNPGIVTLKTWKYETSRPVFRRVPYSFALDMVNKGDFYKAQVVGSYDQILAERTAYGTEWTEHRENPAWITRTWHMREHPSVVPEYRKLVERLRFDWGLNYAGIREYLDHATHSLKDRSRDWSAGEYADFMGVLDETPRENPRLPSEGVWIGGIPEGETGVLMGDLPEGEPFPSQAPTIDQLRWIVDNWQHHKIDGVTIDGTTANVVVQVYDALSPQNQARYGSEPIERMVDIAWKLVRKNNPGGYQSKFDEAAANGLAILKDNVMTKIQRERLSEAVAALKGSWYGVPGAEISQSEAETEIASVIDGAMDAAGGPPLWWDSDSDNLISDEDEAYGVAEYSDIYELNRRDFFAAATGSKNLAQWIRNPSLMDSLLPSEHPRGRLSHDNDFSAGYRAGLKAYSLDPKTDRIAAQERFRQLPPYEHGSWWLDGFATAIEVGRGNFGQKYVDVARRLRLPVPGMR